MALTIKSILKIFLLFLAFQICVNVCIDVLPTTMNHFDEKDKEYLDFVGQEVNSNFFGESEAQTLKDNLAQSIAVENLFDDSLINSFLGVLKIIGQLIRFIVEVALLLLITPGIMVNILLYNFIGASGILFSAKIIVDIYFYMQMFYIVYKTRTSN